MSEQNILNPTAASQLNPSYSIPHKDPATDVSWQARSGQEYDRDMLVRGMEWQLHWDKVPFSTYLSLRQWFRQYRKGFFSYIDFDDNSRYYSGKFLAEPQFERVANNQVNVSATFVEIPKVAMFQYPSNWGVDSIFVEERGDYGQDLVKLTGPWDHSDQNYLLWSEQMDNAAWVKTNCTVIANSITDPNGNLTADAVTYSLTGSSAQIVQTITRTTPLAGRRVTFSGWVKVPSGSPSLNLRVHDQAIAIVVDTAFVVGTGWQRFSVSGIVPSTSTVLTVLFYSPTTASTFHIWGAQLEFATAATTYTQTVGATAALLAPAADANLHNGFAYFNAGTNGSWIAEWVYIGYGFRVWACKGPDMGFMNVYLDGVLLGAADLYSAAFTASAVVFTNQTVALGSRRVKLQATGGKNVASLSFFIAADAIEVMR